MCQSTITGATGSFLKAQAEHHNHAWMEILDMAVILLKMLSNLRGLATNARNVAPKLSRGAYYQCIVHDELIFIKLAGEMFNIRVVHSSHFWAIFGFIFGLFSHVWQKNNRNDLKNKTKNDGYREHPGKQK